MSFFKETPVWAALKKLAMGLGLIALFSAILLVSDLGNRKAASAASRRNHVQVATSGRMVRTAIVYFARDVGTDLCVHIPFVGMRLAEGTAAELSNRAPDEDARCCRSFPTAATRD
jgi:hypothetical protein